jgi:hypothetical protein
MQCIKVYTMPVWYIAVYDGTSRYENLIPGYTGIYRDIRNRMVLSRWWGFQMLMVALCVCTRHIPRYTMLYRHMTVYARDIMISLRLGVRIPDLVSHHCVTGMLFSSLSRPLLFVTQPCQCHWQAHGTSLSLSHGHGDDAVIQVTHTVRY